MTAPASSRLPWIDHLRTLVIILVVNLHACVTYSHVGDWYVKSAHEPTLAAKVPFILWEAHLQSFFMGLLFFISGYFAHGSLARRGAIEFVRERCVRLGLPTLFYMLAVHPFILFVLNPWRYNWGPLWPAYTKYLRSGKFLSSSGPLWFAVALLLFCLVTTAYRAARRKRPIVATPLPAPRATTLWLAALGLGVATFAVRVVQPIGTNVFNLQLCFFVQYIVFFAAGLHAARCGWLLSLAASPHARIAGIVALAGGPALLLAILLVGGRFGTLVDFFGGWHWQAFAMAMWEQLAGVGLSLGTLALVSRRGNVDSPLLRWLSQRSFAVYVFHAPVLVALFMIFRALPQYMYPLIALLTVAGWVGSFVVADLARRVPGLRAIL